MLKRTAKALILTLGLAVLTPTAVRATDHTEDRIKALEKNVSLLLASAQNVNGRFDELNKKLDALAAHGAAKPAPKSPSPPRSKSSSKSATSVPDLSYYVKKRVEKEAEAEQKRILGCVLKDLLKCADDCKIKCDDEDEEDCTTKPASWIYYTQPCETQKNCPLKSAFGLSGI